MKQEWIDAVGRAEALINKRIRNADHLLAKWPDAKLSVVTAGDFEDAAHLSDLAAFLRTLLPEEE